MLASRLAGTAASEGPPQEPPATPGTARQRRQRVCTRFPGCFSFWRRLRRGCRCCRGWLLLLCAGELSGSAGNGNPVEHHSQATAGAANPRTAQEGRRGPAQKLPQASWPRRNKQETPPLAAKAPGETARQAVRGARHRHRHHSRHGRQGQRRQRTTAAPATAAATPAHGRAGQGRTGARGAARPRPGNKSNGLGETLPVFFFFGKGRGDPLLLLPGAAACSCVLVKLVGDYSGNAPTSPRDHGRRGRRRKRQPRRLEPPSARNRTVAKSAANTSARTLRLRRPSFLC